MSTLKGVEKTIKKHRPLLHISAYHKANDILNIVNYIERLKLRYKWFFRVHKPLTIDTVLYGIPEERLV